MLRNRLIGLFLFACVVLGASSVRAQLPKVAKEKPGSLAGSVVDAKDMPVAGAQILWQASDGAKPHVLHSDAAGHFRVAPLRSGIYELRASSGTLRSEWSHNVLVRAGKESTMTLRLLRPAPPGSIRSK